MTRTRSTIRLAALAEAAVQAFVDDGYRRTRIEDVARAAGLSTGTVYLYADGKEALFELAVRQACGDPLPTLDERRRT